MSNFTTNSFKVRGQSNKINKTDAMMFKVYPINTNTSELKFKKSTSLTQQQNQGKIRSPMVLRQKSPFQSHTNLHTNPYSHSSLLYTPLSKTLTPFNSNTCVEQKMPLYPESTDFKKFLKSCVELSVPNNIKEEFLNSFKNFETNTSSASNSNSNSNSNIKNFNLDDKRSNGSETLCNARKRTLSYIWIKNHFDNNQGYVFYGGSVYRQESGDQQFSDQQVKDIIRRLTGDYSDFDLDAVQRLLKRKNSQPRFNREQELHTALERLRKCPVIFKTCAQTHEEVRDEIRKNVFRQGVSA